MDVEPRILANMTPNRSFPIIILPKESVNIKLEGNLRFLDRISMCLEEQKYIDWFNKDEFFDRRFL